MDGNARVIHYIMNETLTRVPGQVVAQAKTCLLDLIGATLGGTSAPGAVILTDFVRTTLAGPPEATILRSSLRVAAPGAALVNGFMANALDIDDGSRKIVGHPGAVVFPAVLALGESRRVSGADLLEALIVGYEVGIRAGLIMRPSYGNVYHCSGSWGAVGVAAACGRLLRLDAGRLGHALGAAECHAPLMPTLREIAHPSMTKDGVAWGAFVGVSAVLLAQHGFTAIPALFADGRYNAPLDTLGHEYEIKELYFKPYPCCRWFQPAIEGTLTLRARLRVEPEEIARIEIATFGAALDGQVRIPRSQEEAEYSLPYCVAASAVHGAFGREQVTNGGWNDPQSLEMAQRIQVTLAPDLDARFPDETLARVAVVTRDGKRHEVGPLPARGGANNPLGEKALRHKYFGLVDGILTSSAAIALAQLVDHIEEVPDIRELVAAMQA